MRFRSKVSLGLTVASLPLGLFGCLKYYFRNVEMVSSSVDVMGTEWRGEVRYVEAHGVIGGNTGLDIRLVNGGTGQTATIAYGAGTQGTLASRLPGEIEVTVPNEGNVTYYNPEIPGVKIVMHFTPKDDPERRRKWFAWYWDRKSEANRSWYCKEYMSTMAPSLRKQTNEMLARQLYGFEDKSGRTYCSDHEP